MISEKMVWFEFKFKMGKPCTILSRSGFREVAVNSGKRSRNNSCRQAPHTNIKIPKRTEVNVFKVSKDVKLLEALSN